MDSAASQPRLESELERAEPSLRAIQLVGSAVEGSQDRPTGKEAADRAHTAAAPQGGRGAAAPGPLAVRLGLSKQHIPLRPKTGELTCYRGASLLELRFRSGASAGAGNRRSGKRKEISEFSDASRRRMLQLMAKVEVSEIPLFVTLTYPDSFPLYHEEFKRHLEVFCARLLRRWPGAAVIWKLEFKERKSGENKGRIAPHYHLFVYGVPWSFPFQRERGQWFRSERSYVGETAEVWAEFAESPGGETCWYMARVDPATPEGFETTNGDFWGADSFRRWVSRNWYDVVATGDERHYRAGTRVERLRSVKGAFAYASKRYMVKKEVMPVLEHKPGRFWGVIARKNLKLGRRENKELTEKQAVQLRRTIRRYRWANTPPEKRRFLRKGGLWTPEFTVRLFCDVNRWIEHLGLVIPQMRNATEPNSS